VEKFIKEKMLYVVATEETEQETEKKTIKLLLEEILTKQNYNSHINLFENSAKEKLETVVINSIVKSRQLD
jgi:hypothetical protein